ncbi:MAG: hypothetical protein ABIH89_06575, partial [Elusimicrobiota bacterium]
MNNNNIQLEFAKIAGMLASRFSLSSTVGQIYGLLFMSPEPVSLNEMVEKLGISKGSASTNVRILESWGAVRKVWVDNTRKDYYEANFDILSIVKSRLKEGIKKRVSNITENISVIKNKIETKDRQLELDMFYKKQLENIEEISERLK